MRYTDETLGWCNDIATCAGRLASRAANTGERAEFMFNETVVYADPGESADVAMNRWWTEVATKRAAYERSPECAAKRLKDAIDQYTEAIANFETVMKERAK